MNRNALIAQYELQTDWLLHALEGFSEEESHRQVSENLSTAIWVAGHLTFVRTIVRGLSTDSPSDAAYQKSFGKGTAPQNDGSFPTLEQIKQDWVRVSAEIKTVLQNLPEEKLLSKPPFQTAIPDETLLGLLAYFALHEAFHIGQLSILRKLLGKGAMAMGRRG